MAFETKSTVTEWSKVNLLEGLVHIQQTRVQGLHPYVRSAVIESLDEADYKGFLNHFGI